MCSANHAHKCPARTVWAEGVKHTAASAMVTTELQSTRHLLTNNLCHVCAGYLGLGQANITALLYISNDQSVLCSVIQHTFIEVSNWRCACRCSTASLFFLASRTVLLLEDCYNVVLHHDTLQGRFCFSSCSRCSAIVLAQPIGDAGGDTANGFFWWSHSTSATRSAACVVQRVQCSTPALILYMLTDTCICCILYVVCNPNAFSSSNSCTSCMLIWSCCTIDH